MQQIDTQGPLPGVVCGSDTCWPCGQIRLLVVIYSTEIYIDGYEKLD